MRVERAGDGDICHVILDTAPFTVGAVPSHVLGAEICDQALKDFKVRA